MNRHSTFDPFGFDDFIDEWNEEDMKYLQEDQDPHWDERLSQ